MNETAPLFPSLPPPVTDPHPTPRGCKVKMNCKLEIPGQALMAGAPAPPSVHTGPASTVASLSSLRYANLIPAEALHLRSLSLECSFSGLHPSCPSDLHLQCRLFREVLLVAVSETIPLTNLVLYPPSPDVPSQHFSLLDVEFLNLVDLFVVCLLHENISL